MTYIPTTADDGAAPTAPPAPRRGRGRPPGGTPNPIDVAFGARIRARRILLGMSQQRLGELIGVTFQQVQKCERGENRVSISRAYAIAEALQMRVGDLVAGIGGPAPDATGTAGATSDRETLEIAKAIARISNREVRGRLHGLAKACAKAEGVS